MLPPRPAIAALAPAYHGGIDYSELRQLGIPPAGVLDFSVCTNPYGPPPGTAAAVRRAAIGRYPDSAAGALRQLLAGRLHLDSACITFGSGSTELIRLVAAAYVSPGDTVLVPRITYAEYALAATLAGARIEFQALDPARDFRLDVTEFNAAIARLRPRLIFVCNPNNPTGQYLSRDAILQVLAAAPRSLVVLDEAYASFADDRWDSTDLVGRANLVILRSMTKDYALAGLRLGYALAAAPVSAVLDRIKPPWNVNAAAQAAGICAVQCADYLETCVRKVRANRQFLTAGLARLRLAPLPTQANFFLVRVGVDAAPLRAALLRRGILVRDCASFGLPGYLRLAARSRPDCRRLLAALSTMEVIDNAR